MPGCWPSRTPRRRSRSLLAGLSVRAHGDLKLALTGAPAPATVDGHAGRLFRPFALADGQVLTLGMPASRAAQLRLGARWGRRAGRPRIPGNRHAVRARDRGRFKPATCLPVGPAPATFPNVDLAPTPPLSAETLVLHALRGPRDDWLADVAALADDRVDGLEPQRPGRDPAWKGSHCSATPARRARSCPARVWFGAQSRFRPAASRSSSWPTIP